MATAILDIDGTLVDTNYHHALAWFRAFRQQGFVVPLWRADLADRIEPVSTDEAVAMALRLAREEGLFAGTSTGANVVAALRVAEELGPDATVVTVMCDTGMKYLKKYGAELTHQVAAR